MKKSQVIIKGAYGSGNFGDDALMFVMAKLLRREFHAKDMVFLCNRDLPYVFNVSPESTIRTAINRGLSGDFLVYGGGTQFFSFPLTAMESEGFITKLMRLMLSPLSSVGKIFNRIKTKPDFQVSSNRAALGVGLGPFVKGSVQELQAYSLFKKLNYISVRDESSLRICEDWGLSGVLLGSDLCFLTKFLPPMPNAQKPSNAAQKRVGIIVRDWPHSKEGAVYLQNILDLAESLRDDSYEVVFISFHEKGDQLIIKELKLKGEKILCWDTDTETINSFIFKLSMFDVFFTARYHGAVFASILSKPVICIGVENKLKMAAEMFHSGAKYWGYPFNIAVAKGLLDALMSNYIEATNDLRRCVALQNKQGMEMLNEFIVYINGIDQK